MTETPKTHSRRNDLILVATLLLLSVTGLLLAFFLRTEGAYCVIKQNGKEIDRLSLSVDRSVIYESENGYNTVTVKNGRVSVTAADCPDKVCVKSKTVHYHGQTIACLPHSFSVTVYGGEDELDIIV